MSIWGNLESRYAQPQPNQQRKILALDGGGIRGVLTLGILAELEQQLKHLNGHGDDFVLAHYFDYIGGTSTGAIIAAGLSIGMPVHQLLSFYEENGEAMFDKTFLFQKFKQLYDENNLREKLKEVFGDGDLDLQTNKFKCLLLIVTMNRDTDSPWPISNNPLAKYNRADHDECNLRIPLYQLVRASTAAPVYFRPEVINLNCKNKEKATYFVDGGMTPYNNPAFLMYRMATQAAYNLNWPTGENKLLIVSIGTGSAVSPGVYKNVLKAVQMLPDNLMYAMQVDQDINCRTVGRCIYGAPIDRELNDMVPTDEQGHLLDLDSDANRHFSYVRYNADLSQKGLDAIGFSQVDSDTIRKMDSVKNIAQLKEVGLRVGTLQVKADEHFRKFLK